MRPRRPDSRAKPELERAGAAGSARHRDHELEPRPARQRPADPVRLAGGGRADHGRGVADQRAQMVEQCIDRVRVGEHGVEPLAPDLATAGEQLVDRQGGHRRVAREAEQGEQLRQLARGVGDHLLQQPGEQPQGLVPDVCGAGAGAAEADVAWGVLPRELEPAKQGGEARVGAVGRDVDRQRQPPQSRLAGRRVGAGDRYLAGEVDLCRRPAGQRDDRSGRGDAEERDQCPRDAVRRVRLDHRPERHLASCGAGRDDDEHGHRALADDRHPLAALGVGLHRPLVGEQLLERPQERVALPGLAQHPAHVVARVREPIALELVVGVGDPERLGDVEQLAETVGRDGHPRVPRSRRAGPAG